MGLRYVGPIDGHDVEALLYYLEHIDDLDGPTMLHIVTRKGKGYEVAESDPITWHGASKFDPDAPVHAGKPYQWSDAFGDAAIELAGHDDRLWVITPAMREGSGLVRYSKTHPDRYLDVGIAEDVAVTTAAGMALRGEKPIVAIYSTFLQRGFDQVVHDVSLENLDVVFAIDRAGLVGGDGATHQGVYDLAYLRALPNLSLAMPRDAQQMRAMLKKALELGGPKAVRWPRGKTEPAPEAEVADWEDLTWGRAEVLKEGSDVWLLGLGPTVGYALAAAGDDPRVGVVDARFVKPLDEALVLRLARSGARLVTIEDPNLPGGFGSAVAELLSDHGVPARLTRLGVPDVVVPHGDPAGQHEELGFGVEALRARLGAWLAPREPAAAQDPEAPTGARPAR
jgi:1-deoxy-D-xylulose-5-phosphate synthase